LGTSAAPGKIVTPMFNVVEEEIERAKGLAGKFHPSIHPFNLSITKEKQLKA